MRNLRLSARSFRSSGSGPRGILSGPIRVWRKSDEKSETNGSEFPYPGIPTTSTGAVAWGETHITQGACAYPITSSTTMGQGRRAEVANGKENLWGDKLSFLELESEHSSAGLRET